MPRYHSYQPNLIMAKLPVSQLKSAGSEDADTGMHYRNSGIRPKERDQLLMLRQRIMSKKALQAAQDEAYKHACFKRGQFISEKKRAERRKTQGL